jgi:hypothetical protein
VTIHTVYRVIEEYDNDPPEPWGSYVHEGNADPKAGDQITLRTLDNKPHHDVTIVRVINSTIYAREAK